MNSWMISARGGPEDNSVLGALRTQVFMNDLEAMLVTLDAIRAEHPYGFDCRDSKHRTALHASCEPQVSPEIMHVLLQPENLMYGGHPNDRTLRLETALMTCVMCDRKHMARIQQQDTMAKARMLLERGADMSIGSQSIPYAHTALHSVGMGGSFNDHTMNIDLLEFVLENGADITLRDTQNRDVLELARAMKNRYAVHLIKLVLTELPFETAKWTHGNFEAMCQSVRMSHHKRDVAMPAMNALPPDMIRKVMQHVQLSCPKNMVAAAMSSIKERHNGRYPILDTDLFPDSDASSDSDGVSDSD